jgi:hypothetical protein
MGLKFPLLTETITVMVTEDILVVVNFIAGDLMVVTVMQIGLTILIIHGIKMAMIEMLL